MSAKPDPKEGDRPPPPDAPLRSKGRIAVRLFLLSCLIGIFLYLLPAATREKLSVLFLSLLAVLGGIKLIVDFAEDGTNREAKDAIYRLLLSLATTTGIVPSQTLQAWSKLCSESLEGVFGAYHWTLRCFVRSSIAMVLTFLAGSLALLAFLPYRFYEGLAQLNAVEIMVSIYSTITHLLFCYVALWKTRGLICWMQQWRIKRIIAALHSTAWQFATAIVFIDFLLTFVILAIGYSLLNVSLVAADAWWIDDDRFYPRWTLPLEYLSIVWRTVTLSSDIHALWFLDAPIEWACFVPTLFLIIFFVARPLLAVARFVSYSSGVALRYLDLERTPFKSIGLAVAIVVTAIYIFVMLPAALFA